MSPLFDGEPPRLGASYAKPFKDENRIAIGDNPLPSAFHLPQKVSQPYCGLRIPVKGKGAAGVWRVEPFSWKLKPR